MTATTFLIAFVNNIVFIKNVIAVTAGDVPSATSFRISSLGPETSSSDLLRPSCDFEWSFHLGMGVSQPMDCFEGASFLRQCLGVPLL